MNALKISSQVFWAAGIFTMPFTVFILLTQASGAGGFNPYASSAIYLSEALIGIALACEWSRGFLNKRKTKTIDKKERGLIWIVLGLGLLAAAMAEDKISALFGLIPLIIALGTIFLTHTEILPLKKVRQIFVLSMALQGTVALLQIILQHSIGISILGEPRIGTEISGVAKWGIDGHTFIRAYGTLPHANLLAGFSLIALFNLDAISKKHRTWLGALVGTGFLLALSKAAFLGVLIGLIITKKISHRFTIPALSIGGLILLFNFQNLIHKEFIQERLLYLKISLKMLLTHPGGVGLNQFTQRMQEFTTIKLQPWQFQPVHNIYLLLINEYGFWSIGFAFIGLKKWFLNNKNSHEKALLISLLIIGFFDHYFLSLPQGILLSGFVIAITTHPKSIPQNQNSHE